MLKYIAKYIDIFYYNIICDKLYLLKYVILHDMII